VTSVDDLSVALVAMRMVYQNATAVVAINKKVAELESFKRDSMRQIAELERFKQDSMRQTERFREQLARLEAPSPPTSGEAAFPPVAATREQLGPRSCLGVDGDQPNSDQDDADSGGDGDDASDLRTHVASQHQGPPNGLPNNAPTVTRGINTQRGVLLHVGPDGETECVPLLAAALQRWVPEGSLGTRQQRKRMLGRVRANLKRSGSTPLGTVAEWAASEVIKSMLRITQLLSTTPVYSVQVLRTATNHS
jgi:hypothetical protein